MKFLKMNNKNPIDTGKKTVTGRTIWRNPETGEDYSERTTTFKGKDGRYYTMPTVDKDGNQYSDDQIKDYVDQYGAIDYITGEELPKFKSEKEAIMYAIERSKTRKQEDNPMNQQMSAFQEGGLQDQGGQIEKESGNEVPIGSLKKEVADDVPAMVSEGEFIFPADVVRYLGLEKLMQLRQEAKMGLKQMEAMGQMGNSDEATMPDDLPFGMQDIVIIAGGEEAPDMARGGVIHASNGTDVNPNMQGYLPLYDNRTVQGNTGNTGATNNTGDAITVTTVDDVYKKQMYINTKTGEKKEVVTYKGKPIDPLSAEWVLFTGQTITPTDDLEQATLETGTSRSSGSGSGPVLSEFQKAGGWGMDITTKEGMDMWLREHQRFNKWGHIMTGIATGLTGGLGGLFMSGANAHQRMRILKRQDEILKQMKKLGYSKDQIAQATEAFNGTSNPKLLGGVIGKLLNNIGNVLGLTPVQENNVREAVSNNINNNEKPETIVDNIEEELGEKVYDPASRDPNVPDGISIFSLNNIVKDVNPNAPNALKKYFEEEEDVDFYGTGPDALTPDQLNKKTLPLEEKVYDPSSTDPIRDVSDGISIYQLKRDPTATLEDVNFGAMEDYLKQRQDAWDAKYAATHNTDGTYKRSQEAGPERKLYDVDRRPEFDGKVPEDDIPPPEQLKLTSPFYSPSREAEIAGKGVGLFYPEIRWTEEEKKAERIRRKAEVEDINKIAERMKAERVAQEAEEKALKQGMDDYDQITSGSVPVQDPYYRSDINLLGTDDGRLADASSAFVIDDITKKLTDSQGGSGDPSEDQEFNRQFANLRRRFDSGEITDSQFNTLYDEAKAKADNREKNIKNYIQNTILNSLQGEVEGKLEKDRLVLDSPLTATQQAQMDKDINDMIFYMTDEIMKNPRFQMNWELSRDYENELFNIVDKYIPQEIKDKQGSTEDYKDSLGGKVSGAMSRIEKALSNAISPEPKKELDKALGFISPFYSPSREAEIAGKGGADPIWVDLNRQFPRYTGQTTLRHPQQAMTVDPPASVPIAGLTTLWKARQQQAMTGRDVGIRPDLSYIPTPMSGKGGIRPRRSIEQTFDPATQDVYTPGEMSQKHMGSGPLGTTIFGSTVGGKTSEQAEKERRLQASIQMADQFQTPAFDTSNEQMAAYNKNNVLPTDLGGGDNSLEIQLPEGLPKGLPEGMGVAPPAPYGPEDFYNVRDMAVGKDNVLPTDLGGGALRSDPFVEAEKDRRLQASIQMADQFQTPAFDTSNEQMAAYNMLTMTGEEAANKMQKKRRDLSARKRKKGIVSKRKRDISKDRKDSSGKSLGDKGYKSKLRERQEEKRKRDRKKRTKAFLDRFKSKSTNREKAIASQKSGWKKLGTKLKAKTTKKATGGGGRATGGLMERV